MVFLLILFGILPAQAQIGGSYSPMWINSSAPSTDEALAHGRYEIKKTKATGQVSARSTAKKKRTPASEVTAEPLLAPAKPEVIQYKASSAKTDAAESSDRSVLSDDDLRKNQMEIQVSPTFVYNGSSANYSYRNYNSFFPALDLSSNVWMTPTLGLYGRILFSFGASVAGDSTTASKVAVKYEDIDLAFKFRKYFSSMKDSQSVDIGLVYSEDKFSPPSDNLYRPKLISSGLGVRVTSRVPSGNNFAWIFGGLFYPRLQHQEEKVGLKISSGSGNENARLGLNFGSELKLSRGSQIIYDLAVTSERDSFDGAANPIDPETQKAPSNVSVTNTMVMFSFGYRWGR